ncbi:ATP-dependent RecD-like DNA helicase [Heliophilum fasciatum]|uniref:ATP-dependent RecD2 DNA helicase n=1 Tax=Heliophilum fasciatum TaxID=35700 RepID=A0A4R2RAX8_9FIRM|nr:ATP-dependent RecD-like DNA helicase [Heliophilum fasciatum]MCW2279301.1 exodeoxyribonuclease V alpha subunit [Heliophilum fasciatum]TCP60462.1 exodeoxyribonuclease V alpha subunit [Heliophilum fasciatum]
MTELEGELIRIIFQQEAYTVAVFKVDDERITAVGPLLCPETGVRYALTGNWTEHARFGKQFRFETYRMLPPTSLKAMEKFLAAGVIKGLGRKTAKKLVEAFGLEVLTVLRDRPQAVYEVPGISKARADEIVSAYQEFAFSENLMVVLNSYGLESELVIRLFRKYGRECLQVVEENPYRLCLDLRDISFERCDRLASHLGFRGDEVSRFQAALLYALWQARDEGHVFLPSEQLLREAETILSGSTLFPEPPEAARIQAELIDVAAHGLIRIYQGGCYLPALHTAEEVVALSIYERVQKKHVWKVDVDRVLATMQRDFGIEYAPEQKEAFYSLAKQNLLVITGGPGTGKTTIVRGLLAVVERARPNAKVVLCAPTGRAAKRLAETTGQPASTLHKVLKLRAGSNDEVMDSLEPLEGDVVIVDEVSMVDIGMMANLLHAMPATAKLILVGDKNQLPPVGPGQFLHDIIEQGLGSIIELRHIFRQAGTSDIVTNAHRINGGEMPVLENRNEFIFLSRSSITDCVDALAQTVQRAIERAGYLLDDVQVLSPMRYTEAGVTNLNQMLQNLLNPAALNKREVKAGYLLFRDGDKVMQLKNNYDKDVFNGDTGFIVDIALAKEDEVEEDTLYVVFEHERIPYVRSEWDQLTLAYASTVHKAQGSEYPVVVMPLVLQHRRMLRRNLLYTAVTRAREKVILIGDAEAVRIAVQNAQDMRRYSQLPLRWTQLAGGEGT